MCGISGVISLNKNNPISDRDLTNANRMNTVLRHRGPNSQALKHDKNCILGNTRLNIIDLSHNADLPMQTADGNIILAYNGEITNFRKLKKEFSLESKYTFHSSSDSEVLLHMYQEMGIDCLKHLSGMFAFTLYDKKLGKVFIVRDFYGIRPLFYRFKNDRLYFSSEIKSFLEIDDFSNDIDTEAIYHYFALAYIPGQKTPFTEIDELADSHYIEIDLNDNTHKIQEYYTIDYTPNYDLNEKETTAIVHDMLTDSLDRNLISDAPLGMTLSGGIDTSCMLGMAKALGKSKNLHTYSIKIDEPSFDESYYQQLMANYAQTTHHEIKVTGEDVLENLIQHMAFMDEPSGDGAAVPSYILAKEAKKDVSVLLSGEGGDEVFNAYETHGAYVVRNLYRKATPSLIRKLLRKTADKLPTSYHKLSFDFLFKRFTHGAERNIPEAHFFWRHALNKAEQDALMPNCKVSPSEKIFTEMFNSLNFDDDLNKLSLIDIKYFFVCDLMVKNDRTFMAHSVEARFPFMDRELIDFTSKIPTDMKVKKFGFNRRYIQKQAMKPYLPKEIFNRKNMGLEMPHSLWFLNTLKPLADKYFSKSMVEKTQLLSFNAVNTMWQEHKMRKKDHGRSLWCILNFIIWFELFIEKKNFKNYLNN